VIWVKLALAVALIAGVVYGVNAYNGAIEEAERQKNLATKIAGERDGWIEVVEQEKAAKVRAETALKARDRERVRLQRERDDARASLAMLRRTDPVVAKWADVELPPAIVQRLRDLTAERPASKADSGKASGNSVVDRARPEVRRIP
jgi:hypothetical protein